jgi:hypothetical protein
MMQDGAVLRVVGPAQLNAAMDAEDTQRANASQAAPGDMSSLAGYIRERFEFMRRHRNTAGSGWSDRLLNALRVFNGTYDSSKLQQIRQFGGSEVYARVIAMKCRGASALLRDVYLSPDRPWGLKPPADPDIPAEIIGAIQQLVESEMASMQEAAGTIDQGAVRDRMAMLLQAARKASKKKAAEQASIAEDKIEEILEQGGFYKALAEFITDLPLFPYAAMKGPVVRVVPTVVWAGGRASIQNLPRLFWSRISPFDLYWTPGVSDIEDAETIERTRLTRADLNDLLDLPGYNSEAIYEILDLYGRGGIDENWDNTDAERAIQENRENPRLNQSGLISCLEFTGNVQGRMLLEYGFSIADIKDPLRDYFVQAWLIGRYVIKVQLAPSPRKRHPYFITSFEKVPGTPVGNGLPDILEDIGDVCNATLRALVNNLSIASGPQVVVNDERLAPGENGEELYPWKRWHLNNDKIGAGSEKPVDFFQPNSNAQELLAVYKEFMNMADELSAIPKYLSGGGASGGAGRTASGLAMLMGNASKILQTVAANVDRDVLTPLLTSLFDMLMMTDTSGLLSGQEQVQVLGVSVAVQKETQRARQMEFLQATANPIDVQITGPKGRAAVLRSVANTLGLDGEAIVPTDDVLEQMQKASEMAAAAQGQPGHGGMGEPAAAAQGGQKGPGVNGDQGPRTQIAGGSQ